MIIFDSNLSCSSHAKCLKECVSHSTCNTLGTDFPFVFRRPSPSTAFFLLDGQTSRTEWRKQGRHWMFKDTVSSSLSFSYLANASLEKIWTPCWTWKLAHDVRHIWWKLSRCWFSQYERKRLPTSLWHYEIWIHATTEKNNLVPTSKGEIDFLKVFWIYTRWGQKRFWEGRLSISSYHHESLFVFGWICFWKGSPVWPWGGVKIDTPKWSDWSGLANSKDAGLLYKRCNKFGLAQL